MNTTMSSSAHMPWNSTWLSTASFGRAISSSFGCGTFAMARAWRPVLSFFNKRLIDQCSLKSPSQPAALGDPSPEKRGTRILPVGQTLRRRLKYSSRPSSARGHRRLCGIQLPSRRLVQKSDSRVCRWPRRPFLRNS